MMLQDYHKKIILLGLLIISTIIILQFNISFNWATGVSVLSFVSFITILYRSIGYEDNYYTSTRVFFTVTIYSIVMVALYWWLSWYIEGDTYIFSKVDAIFYERISMRLKDMSYTEGLIYLKTNDIAFDDLGALFMMSTILKVVPSKIFLNFCYVIMGGITAIALFRTGCRIMSRQYAYLAAVAYAISSYNIFFYGSFLKETGFVLLIALLFNSLYKYFVEKNSFSIIYVVVYSVLICFFRPATAVFIWFGIFVYYFFRSDFSVGKVTMIIILGVSTLFLMGSLEEMFNRYTLNGDINRLLNTKESTTLSREVSYVMNFFASLFGPFPTLIGMGTILPSLYGPGLLYKFFMNLPFWLAAWKIIRNKITILYPMLFFILIEALAAAFVQKGFELRITLPHVAMFFLITFWYFSNVNSQEERIFQKYTTPFLIMTFGIILGWGVLRS